MRAPQDTHLASIASPWLHVPHWAMINHQDTNHVVWILACQVVAMAILPLLGKDWFLGSLFIS